MRKCEIEGCETQQGQLRRGMCSMHYRRWQRYGDPHTKKKSGYPPKLRKCEVEGCDNKHHSRGMCDKHYNRWKSHGDTFVVEKGGRPRGDNPTYGAAHQRLVADYGKASEHDCSVCFEPADEWAFIREWCPDNEVLRQEKDFPNGRRRVVEYSLDPAHYLTLCRSDHNRLDKGIYPSWELSMSAS